MAKARTIVKRRAAVRNIRKITQTMQLIATARYQRCLQRALSSRPYTERITEMLRRLSKEKPLKHALLRPNRGLDRSVLLTITSNRGLCGAYNAAVLRAALQRRRELLDAGVTPGMEMVGKKGINYCRFLRIEPAERITDVDDRIAFERVAAMADGYMRRYRAGEIARVDVAFTRFESVGVQRATVLPLLPIELPAEVEEEPGPASIRPQFEFSPPARELLARFLPELVRIRLFQCFNDALASEQVARMVAMKAATEAAGDMIKYLTRDYNRARQAQITLELADIVGGTRAVE